MILLNSSMKTIQIKADDFFELLKTHGVSMWDLFEQMIDGEEKHLFFLNKEQEVIANYILPTSVELLHEDQEVFKNSIADKLSEGLTKN